MEERGLGPMEFGVGCMNICLGPDAGLNFSVLDVMEELGLRPNTV